MGVAREAVDLIRQAVGTCRQIQRDLQDLRVGESDAEARLRDVHRALRCGWWYEGRCSYCSREWTSHALECPVGAVLAAARAPTRHPA